MIDFLQEAFVFFIFATPAMAVIALLNGLLVKEMRRGILPGLLGIAIGFCLGAGLNGIWGRNDSWGNSGHLGLAGAISGVCYGAAGFLIGFGAVCTKRDRTTGWIFIAAGLALPLAHFGFVELRPALARSEMAWWQSVLANGPSGISVEEGRAHLSEPTRMALDNEVNRHGGIAPSALRFLWHVGIDDSRYEPIPADFAEEIYAQLPKDYNLARNPTAPPDILEKFAESNDPACLLELCRNTGLPKPVADKLKLRLEKLIEDGPKKDDPNWFLTSTAKDLLRDLENSQKAAGNG